MIPADEIRPRGRGETIGNGGSRTMARLWPRLAIGGGCKRTPLSRCPSSLPQNTFSYYFLSFSPSVYFLLFFSSLPPVGCLLPTLFLLPPAALVHFSGIFSFFRHASPFQHHTRTFPARLHECSHRLFHIIALVIRPSSPPSPPPNCATRNIGTPPGRSAKKKKPSLRLFHNPRAHPPSKPIFMKRLLPLPKILSLLKESFPADGGRCLVGERNCSFLSFRPVSHTFSRLSSK